MLGFFRRRRAPAPIDPADWQAALDALPFLARRNPRDLADLRALAERFLAVKTVSGAAGCEPDGAIRAIIAAQACLPVLRLPGDLENYGDFVEIVVYPGGFSVPRRQEESVGDLTLTHEWQDELAGEAFEHGPVVLSWEDVSRVGHDAGYCVVVHEFVHKLDFADGCADGCPPMPVRARAAWMALLEREFDAFRRLLDGIEDDIPAHVDPEGPEAAPWYDTLPLDPYAATDPAEFFAVAAESYFVETEAFQARFPDLADAFDSYFRQHP